MIQVHEVVLKLSTYNNIHLTCYHYVLLFFFTLLLMISSIENSEFNVNVNTKYICTECGVHV